VSEEAVITYWPIILSIFFSVVWFVRLEAKVLYLEKQEKDHWDKLDEMQDKLDKIAESLARLEGRLE
jgi:dsDNA-binding SOS-regulon protein